MTNYPSNITRDQLELIRGDFETFSKRTGLRKVDLFDVFNAVLCELRAGDQWRQSPHDFPKWQTVYTYFAMWSKPLANSENSLIELLKKNVARERLRMGRSVRTSFVILDAQSVKNKVTPQNKGYDSGKKISGIKRHLADDDHTGENFAQSVRAVIGADVIIAKQSDLKNGYVTLQRWIVEQTFSWLEKWRRLWFNCERKLHTSQMMVTLAFIAILLRRR